MIKMRNYSTKIILISMSINIVFILLFILSSIHSEGDAEKALTEMGFVNTQQTRLSEEINMTEKENLLSETTQSSNNFIDMLFNMGGMISMFAKLFFGSIVTMWKFAAGGTMLEQVGAWCITVIFTINNYVLFKELLLLFGKQRD